MIEDIAYDVLEEMGFKDKIKKAIEKSLDKINLEDYTDKYLKEELDEWIRDWIEEDYDITELFKEKVTKFVMKKVKEIKF